MINQLRHEARILRKGGANARADLMGSAADEIEQQQSRIAELEQRIDEMEAQVPKWISVEDELPPTDVWVLWLDGGKTMTPHCGEQHIDKINKRGECLVNYAHNYTHWMPLPLKEVA